MNAPENTTLDQKIEQLRINVQLRNEKEKYAADAELLGTAMQQLLPEIFEEKRAIPNCFLRGALFGMVKKGKRALVSNVPIFTMSQYGVTFSGEWLDQNDLELWDSLIYLAKTKNVQDELRITMYELLTTLRMPDNGINRKTIITRIKRLAFGQVTIKNGMQQYFGSLINDGYIDDKFDGKIVIRYNKKLTTAFSEDFTFISVDIRHLLGSNQLAKWLYNFYESHKEPIPFAIDFLQKLCRSENSSKDFKYRLKIALDMVKKAHLSTNYNSKWDWEISDNDHVFIYPNGCNKNQLKLFKKF